MFYIADTDKEKVAVAAVAATADDGITQIRAAELLMGLHAGTVCVDSVLLVSIWDALPRVSLSPALHPEPCGGSVHMSRQETPGEDTHRACPVHGQEEWINAVGRAIVRHSKRCAQLTSLCRRLYFSHAGLSSYVMQSQI